MTFNIYIIDDDQKKLACFPLLLDEMKPINTAHTYSNGFGDRYREASKDFDLIVEKIDASEADPHSIWLLDLKTDDKEYAEIAEKLINHYYSNPNAIAEKYQDVPESIVNDLHFALALTLMAILDDRNVPYCLISTASRIAVTRIFSERNCPDIPYPERQEQRQQIREAARRLATFISESIQHPVHVLLDSLRNENCHIGVDSDYKCLKCLSNFLAYESWEKFMKDFDLFDESNEYQQPNVFEETLKCFAANGVEGLPLSGVALIAWAAYRQSRNNAKRRILKKNSSFRDDLIAMNEALRSEDNDESNYGPSIVRYFSVIPNQSAATYKHTLTSLYDMIQELIVHDQGKGFTIQRTKLESYEWTISFAIGKKGELVRTLNVLHKNLIDILTAGRFDRNHIASNKILKWWLYSCYSDKERSYSTDSFPNEEHWGAVSRFKVICREDSGTDLKFLVL